MLALLMLPTPALADATIGGKTVDCYCTDRSGGRIELGETICLHVDGKMFMAQCQMSLNVPMWRKLSDGCLSSELFQPRLDPLSVDPHIATPKS
ncbi:hypothetical protein FLO80_11865 [Aquicoccus porphyridii]|uniref:Uncharacterized protein n=2 Tax=Aquicoccus porphyridii TaxID=1852029 RepID=A0A5A9ZCJ2_9RHOB|nr:hypothetical protein FLO80_11865 [Aquicoccus porphyridii]RAI53410.1 hypothetical protein DOO74_13415 [Rhodobacteraceae bacterium AsT-22]